MAADQGSLDSGHHGTEALGTRSDTRSPKTCFQGMRLLLLKLGVLSI